MKQQQLSGPNEARISELGFPHIHMAYVYSDLNTFSACVRPEYFLCLRTCWNKAVVALELTVTFFCVRGERELKEGISFTGYNSDRL